MPHMRRDSRVNKSTNWRRRLQSFFYRIWMFQVQYCLLKPDRQLVLLNCLTHACYPQPKMLAWSYLFPYFENSWVVGMEICPRTLFPHDIHFCNACELFGPEQEWHGRCMTQLQPTRAHLGIAFLASVPLVIIHVHSEIQCKALVLIPKVVQRLNRMFKLNWQPFQYSHHYFFSVDVYMHWS